MSVLLIERDAVVARALRRWCSEASPFRVSGVARDPEEATRLASRIRPRIVLLDLAVVGMAQAEPTLLELRRVSPGARLVAFSGPEYRMPAFDLPVDDFVARPHGLRTMAEEQVVRAVDRRLQHAFDGVAVTEVATA